MMTRFIHVANEPQPVCERSMARKIVIFRNFWKSEKCKSLQISDFQLTLIVIYDFLSVPSDSDQFRVIPTNSESAVLAVGHPQENAQNRNTVVLGSFPRSSYD